MDSNQIIIEILSKWGIKLYTGVTGGGVIHFLKYLSPCNNSVPKASSFFTLAEYSAGFAPLGYYLSSGRTAATVVTTGAATKLVSCGLSDAKLHDIPAVYIVPVSGKSTEGFSPLQDTTQYGSNILQQLKAELPNSVFVLNDKASLIEQLANAKIQLEQFKPVVLILDNEGLNNNNNNNKTAYPDKPHEVKVTQNRDYDFFIKTFRQCIAHKRLLILVGEEMARYPDAVALTSALSVQLRAGMIWSINGANAVSRESPYGYGYVSFGGNDFALEKLESLHQNDVLLILGSCLDEYTINFNRLSASHIFFAGNIPNAYGLIENSPEHAFDSTYTLIQAPLNILLQKILDAGQQKQFENLPAEPAPQNLNHSIVAAARKEYVDMVALYRRLDTWWPPESIGFDDICLSYKDRQYVTQRPNNNIHFYSLYRGSAMGGAFGTAIGAKLASPERSVFLFTGDGCFRLFAGSMGEVSGLGLVVFLLNNGTLGIVEQGL
ncbi:MAG: thiamine pyrophosphate-dependent enzyme, partial [Flavobacterium sp.]